MSRVGVFRAFLVSFVFGRAEFAVVVLFPVAPPEAAAYVVLVVLVVVVGLFPVPPIPTAAVIIIIIVVAVPPKALPAFGVFAPLCAAAAAPLYPKEL